MRTWTYWHRIAESDTPRKKVGGWMGLSKRTDTVTTMNCGRGEERVNIKLDYLGRFKRTTPFKRIYRAYNGWGAQS